MNLREYLVQHNAPLVKSLPSYKCAFCGGDHELIPVCGNCMGGIANPMGDHSYGDSPLDTARVSPQTGEPTGKNKIGNAPVSRNQGGDVRPWHDEPVRDPATGFRGHGPTSGHSGTYPTGDEPATKTAGSVGSRSGRQPGR